MCRPFSISLLTLSLLTFAFSAHAERLVISSPAIPPVSGCQGEPGYLKDIIKEAGKRAGIDISFKVFPAQRSLKTSNKGVDSQGELHRVEGLEKQFPNLVRVPEAVLIDRFVGFSTKPDVVIKDWLDTDKLQISYPRGWKIFETAFGVDAEHQPGLHGLSLFHMADRGRIDIAMHTLDKGSYIIQKAGLKLYPVEPAFAIKPMFLYLHKSKTHLLDKLANAIREVKGDGTYTRIKKEVLHNYKLTDAVYFSSPFDKTH